MARLSDEEFVRIWESSSSRQEVADRCGVTGAAVGMRAQKLRELGVELKKFMRGRPKKIIRVDDLNALIEGLNDAHNESQTQDLDPPEAAAER